MADAAAAAAEDYEQRKAGEGWKHEEGREAVFEGIGEYEVVAVPEVACLISG